MVPVQLIDDLAEETEEVLRHMRCPSPHGDSEIHIFKYGLPVIPLDGEEGEEDEPFPYLIIRPAEGETGEGISSTHQVHVGMLIGIYDRDTGKKGDIHVLKLIKDIMERFMKNPALAGKYYAEEKINWVLQAEDTYPYFFGGIEMTFNIPAVRRESKYA